MVTIEIYGFEGRGKTLKEAKADAQEQARRAMTGTYTPFVLSFRGATVFIWREPKQGWQSRLIDKSGPLYGGSDDSREEAIAKARDQLARTEWDGVEEESPILTHPADQASFRSWAQFQKRYQAAYKVTGSDVLAHRWAGGDPSMSKAEYESITAMVG